MTYLPAAVLGRWFYLYLILDAFSRKIAGFEVHDTDYASHTAHLAKRTALAEGIHAMKDALILHGENGSTIKSTALLAMPHWLAIQTSYSRLHVSNNNAFVESLFRTAKKRSELPSNGFDDLQAARAWATHSIPWSNHEHLHSAIPYVSPSDSHDGLDGEMRQRRHALYLQTRKRSPRRWSRHTRQRPRDVVPLNPEREAPLAATVAEGLDKHGLVA